MAHTRRIPTSKPLFFSYMKKNGIYIMATTTNPITGITTTNWVRVNWTSEEKDQFLAFAAQAAIY
ncbi:MAG: hypothetical protein ACYDEC_17260, partial [Bacteroidia bacterium]